MNEKEQTMNNMEQLIASMQDNSNAKNRWIDTKIGWINYCHNKDKEKEALTKHIGKFFPSAIRDSNLAFTVVKKGNKIWVPRLEEALERAIAAINDKNMRNQYNINEKNPKEAVDLIILDEKEVMGLIELKPWESNNNPTYAFVELLKNYWLAKNNKSIKELILLAPLKYYQRYRYKKPITEFLNTIRKFNDNDHKVKFELKYIELKYEDFHKLIKDLANPIVWQPVSHTKRFSEVTTIDFSKPEFKKKLAELKESLIYSNWKTIADTNSWPKK